MEPLFDGKGVRLFHADCLTVLRSLPDASVDSVVTDPPYELGFMGKAWDNSGIAYSVELWEQCLRVLKPGGHLLAFGGTRTWHRLACAIEDAGFEIRDSIAWLYGSGFPKSLDVSKAIDKGSGENRERQLRFTAWMRSTGITGKQINDITGTNMGGHYLTDASQPAIATADLFDLLRPYLPEVPEEIERLVAERTGIEWTAYKQRPVINEITKARSESGNSALPSLGTKTVYKTWNETIPATADAQRWQGWGTALKPAFEPIVVARKPLSGTVAANVLTHGTGGLNIDGCRIGDGTGQSKTVSYHDIHGNNYSNASGSVEYTVIDKGRWPANVVLDESAAAVLDESRFFYVAKASKSERPKVDGVAHPTVKPLSLMHWLLRLVTPPNGVVLEPFAGSGTTVEAAIMEGKQVIACEMTDDYLPLILERINRAETPTPDLFGEVR